MDDARTYVFSDCHGYPHVVVNVLEDIEARDGGLRRGVDRLVFAGDFLDRGPLEGARECLELFDEHGVEVLWGNHDLAILVGYEIHAQDKASDELQDELRRRFREGGVGGGPRWQLVAAAGDVLISHAGVSGEYADDLEECGGDRARFVRRLNCEFHEAVEHELATGEWRQFRVRNETSPAHHKLTRHGTDRLLPGVVQVIGHTSPEKLARGYGVHPSVELSRDGKRDVVSGRAFASRGLYLTDPSVQWALPRSTKLPAMRRTSRPPAGLYRYAVITAAGVEVRERAR